MKGKNHLISGIILIFIILMIDLFTGLKIYSFAENNFALVAFSSYLFFAGLLLPDADKTNTWIFKFFFPFAVISWLAGFIISTMRGKKFRHRGLLHSVPGILLTSALSAILGFVILSLFYETNYTVLGIFFTSILFGQLLHLIFD
jgi:hypothetical protein